MTGGEGRAVSGVIGAWATCRIGVQSQKALSLIAKMSSILLQIEVRHTAGGCPSNPVVGCPTSLTTTPCRHWPMTANSWTCRPWLLRSKSSVCLYQHKTMGESHVSLLPNKATLTPASSPAVCSRRVWRPPCGTSRQGWTQRTPYTRSQSATSQAPP